MKKRATTTKSKTGLRARRKTAGVKTPDTLRTVVVGGDAGYRRAVLRLLKAHPRLAVAGSAGSAVEAEVLLQQCSPQLALIDVRLPDRSGFELVRDVKRKHPDVKIVLIASEDGKEYRAAAALAGADGLMSRDELARQLSAWIRKFLAAPGSRRARGDAQETLVTRSASTGAEKTRNRFRSTFNQAAVGIMHSTTEGWILEANRCLCDMLGYSSNELRTRNTRDLTHPDDRDRQDAQRLELLAGLRSSFSSEKRYVRKDGRVIWVNRTVALGYETPETDPYMIHTIEDITGRKHAVQALQQSQKQYAGLVDSLDSIVWEADAQTFQFTFVSQRAEKLLGYPVKRWLEEPTFWQDHIHPEDRDWAVAYCIAATHELRSHDFEYRMIAADGRAVWLRDIVSVEAENGRPVRSRGVMVDITAGKQAEMDSRRHARARQVLGDCSHTLVHANDEAELLKEMCRIVVESGGYVQAHIGLALKDDRKTIAPVASAGYEAGYLESKQLTWSEDGSSASMTGRVVATGKQYISRDIFIDPHSRHLVERARRRGFRSMIGLPLKIEGTCIGAISIYAREQDAFDDEEVALLATLADDISFGMSSLRARAAHERTETELARVMRARTVLAECSRALVHAVNEADLLREMCRIIVDSGGYQQGWVGLANADPARPVLPVAHAGYQDDAPMAYTGLSPDGRERGVAVTAMTSGETAVARDILNQPGHSWRRERALRNGFQSSIALPLRGDGRVLGVLVMHAPEADAFSDEEIALLTTLVDDIGFGVIKLRADAARREAEARLVRLARARKVMAECSQALVHATDETRLLDGMCRIAVESGGFRQAWIAEVTGDNPLRVRAAAQAGYGGGAPMTGASNWAADGSYQGLAAEAITSGAISIARDILNDPRQARKRHRALELNYQSSIALPLREKGGVIGALVLHAAEKDAFDDEEIALLDGLVADLSYGIANLRMQRARLQAEAAQRESEQRFRNTFEQAAVGITRVDLGGVLVDVNQKFCDMLGYSKDELLGRHVRDITHPDDYGKGAQYRAELSHRAMSSAAGEKRFVRKDGSVLWARRTMSTARDETGKPLYLISVVEDITERKELEQRYRETFDQAAVGIVHSALDGRYIRVNRKFCEMAGYADSELIGQTADLLTHPDDLEQTRRNRRLMADGKADQQTGEKRYIRKDGRVIWVRRTASYARDAAGNPMYIIRVIEDITERKHAESALQRKTELAQLLESLARAANEAATPESAMRTCLERLCEHGNWALGRLGIYGADEQERFPENTLWQSKDPARYEPVMQASVDPKYFSPRGIFITTVRKERRPIWLADIASSPGFGRMRVALDCGLRSAFAFPVIVGDEVAAFLEFFGTEPREADTQLLEAIGSVGAQLARLIERSRALKATLELAAIVESSNDAIIGRSLDGIITSWNAGAERMLGYSAAEAIGQPIGFFLPPGQNVRISEINEKVQHGESITPHDTRRLTSDGRVLVVRSSISPLRNSVGKVIGASQILQDVTALRRAEAVRSRLAAIVDSSSDAIISRGLNGEILTWNPAAERLFGWTAQEAIGRDMRLIVPPERIGENAPYREKVHEGLAVPDYDTWRLTKDGKQVAVSLSQSPIRNEQGEVVAVSLILRDITERKELEQRFRESFDQAAVGIVHSSLDGRYLRVNRKFCEMLGYAASELIGESGERFSHPDDASIGVDKRKRMLEGALDTFSQERRYIRKDGRVIWTNRTVSLARDAAGNPMYFIRVVEDITEHKTLERQFRDTFEQAAVGILHTGLDGRYLRVNRKLCEITGYTQDELTRGPQPKLSHPDDVNSGHADRTRLLSGEIDSHNNEKRYVRRDGTVIWVNRTESLARDASGKPEYFIRMIEDITGRKAAEERYRATFDNAPMGIMHTEIDSYRILRANPKLCEMLGYTQDELLGMSSTEFVHPDYRFKDTSRYKEQMVGDGLQTFSSERKFVRKDGSPFWVNRTVSLVRDASGKPDYFIRIVEDITERKHAEEVIASERALLRTVVDAVPDRIYVKDREGHFLLQNMANARAHGARSPEELLGKTIFDIMPRAAAERIEAEDRAILLSETPVIERERSSVDGAGNPRWVAASKVPLRDATGNVIGIVGVNRDITERKISAQRREVEHAVTVVLAEAPTLEAAMPHLIRTMCEGMGWAYGARWLWNKEENTLVRGEYWSDFVPDFTGVDETPWLKLRFQAPGGLLRRAWFEKEPTWIEDVQREESFNRKETALKFGLHSAYSFPIIAGTEVIGVMEFFGRQPRQPDSMLLQISGSIGRQIGQFVQRKQAESALKESEQQFRQLAENIPQVFWITDVEQHEAIYVSPAWEEITGRPLDQIHRNARSWLDSVHEEDRARVKNARKSATGGGYDESFRIVRPDGSVRWVHDRAFPVQDDTGAVYRIAGIAEDVTERKLAETQLMQLAHYDVLTNLPNRVLFYDRLKQALAQARRNQWNVGVLFIDVDRFKNVNDTLGHAMGDKLLQQVSERLTGAVRAGDTVGRLGGDEFSIVLSNLTSAQDANLVAQKIMAGFNEPFKLDSAEIYVTASIGITLYPDDSIEQDTLIKNADAAMYRAKELGRNSFQFYMPEMNTRAQALLSMESSLRRALDRGELILHYQPKASAATGEITGVEALLRWQSPDRGLVSPAEFIPVLEETGLIVPVGEWVIKAACAQVKAWQRSGVEPVPVAVNLSARQFQSPKLGASIVAAIEESGIEPRFLELEITESSLMQNADGAISTLQYLKSCGINVSIDDFGTGYSSLAYLKRFPLDALKIDRSFVRDITSDPDDATITRAVISMAHSLGLKVVAEGVETESQFEFLAENGCDEIQGYYFSRPLTADDCGSWLGEKRRLVRLSQPAEFAPTVLLVDDDDDTLALLKRSLAKDGYQLLTARNAHEALGVLGRHRVDLVISDQNMPGVQGVEFLQRVKRLHPRTMRMMTSGDADVRIVTDAINKGEIFRFLPKGMKEEQLRSDVREAMQARQRFAPERSIPPGSLGK